MNRRPFGSRDKRRCVKVVDPAAPLEERNHTANKDGTPTERLLAKRKQKLQELIKGAREGDTVTIQRIAAEGFNLNSQDDDGWTALHHAAQTKNDNVIELLIKLGVNRNIRNNHGQTSHDIVTETSIDECF